MKLAESERTALPTHVEEAIQAMAAMHTAHQDQASATERLIDHMTATVARPGFLFGTAAGLCVWIAGNMLAQASGYTALDPWPLPFLSLLIACAAFFIAVLILASQRRADRLANLREQMTLEMVLLTTQKTSKLIDLIEEFRRDSPDVKDRIDLEAVEMSGMPDHDQVLSAIHEINDNLPAPK